MASATGSGDHTFNKVALYSAIFAGVAYVGYSCAKDAFSRSSAKRGKGKKVQKVNSINRDPKKAGIVLRIVVVISILLINL